MTWQSFFDISTMPHRHLLFSYMTVLIVQGGYFAWVAWNWLHTKGADRSFLSGEAKRTPRL